MNRTKNWDLTTRKTSTIAAAIAVLGALISAPEASAKDGRAQALLDRALSSTGPDYVAARSALLELGDEARRVVEARHATSTFAPSTWREDVTSEALLAWFVSPEAARRAASLEGVTPGKYLRFRRPEPEVGRELARLDLPPALLFELELRVRSAYPFAPQSAYPAAEATTPDADATERWKGMRTREMFALRAGTLGAIARSAHPARGHLLKARLGDPDEDVRIRRIAALELSVLGAEATPILGAIALDPTASTTLRTGALAGLGRVRTSGALATILKVMARDEALEIQRAAISSLAALASTWATEHAPGAGDADGARLREEASNALVTELMATRVQAERAEDNLIEALAMVATPSLRARLAELAHASERPDDVKRRAARAESRVERALRRL